MAPESGAALWDFVGCLQPSHRQAVCEGFELANRFRKVRSDGEAHRLPLAQIAELPKMFPGEKPGVVAIVPSDFHGVVALQFGGHDFDSFRDVIHINHSLAGEFVDAVRARTTTSQKAERQPKRFAAGPTNLEDTFLAMSTQHSWRGSHEGFQEK